MAIYTEEEIDFIRNLTDRKPKVTWQEQSRLFNLRFGRTLVVGQVKYIRLHHVRGNKYKKQKKRKEKATETGKKGKKGKKANTKADSPDTGDDDDDDDDDDDEGGSTSTVTTGAELQPQASGSQYINPALPPPSTSQLPLPAFDPGLAAAPALINGSAGSVIPAASGSNPGSGWTNGQAGWTPEEGLLTGLPLTMAINTGRAPLMPSETGYTDAASYPDPRSIYGAGPSQYEAPQPSAASLEDMMVLDGGQVGGSAGFGDNAAGHIPVDPRIFEGVPACQPPAVDLDARAEDELVREMMELWDEEE